MSDLISRQAALDIERNATVDTNPSHFEAHQKFTQFMDDAEISSFGRWQWSNGFNTALTAVGIDLKKLPSAQPNHNAEPGKMEIVQCKDCKFAHMTVNGECKYCDIWFPDEKTYVPGDYFCGSAERKEEADCDYERAVEQLEHDMLYEPTFNPDDGSM